MNPLNLKKNILITILILLSLPHMLSAQEPGIADIKNLFTTDSRMKIYAGIREDIITIFSGAAEKQLPLSILLEKLQEGKNKRVKPDIMLKALKIELANMIRGAAVAAEIGYTGEAINSGDEEQKIYVRIIRTVCLAISGRMGDSAAGFMFKKAFEKKKDGNTSTDDSTATAAAATAAIETAVAAIHAIIGILAVSDITGEEILKLGECMINSQVPVSSFNSFPSFYIPGRIKRMTASEITRIICEVLDRGGGIIQIEQEIERRRMTHTW